MKAFKRIFAAATLLVTTGLASEVNAQVPLEDFFKNPEKVGYQISPDGKYFSYMAPYENRLNLFVQEIGSTRQPELLRKQHVTWQEVCGQMVIGFFT